MIYAGKEKKQARAYSGNRWEPLRVVREGLWEVVAMITSQANLWEQRAERVPGWGENKALEAEKRLVSAGNRRPV